MSRGSHFKRVMSGGEHQILSKNFQVQQTGDGIYLWMVGCRPGVPYLKHENLVTSSSNVVARVHVGASASALRQSCRALHWAPAMAIAIKSENGNTRPATSKMPQDTYFNFFFQLCNILKIQNF